MMRRVSLVGVAALALAACSTSTARSDPAPSPHPWWHTGVIYQIYPRSFQDSDGDGIGDLRGITRRLDYLKGLGVDALWISPIYPSPMADFGYDVSDYTNIDPRFGTLQDFEALLREAHERGLRVLLDFVPNHTSDQHPWFVESRKSRDNPKRDWYIWRDPKAGGGPPNNWVAVFGGPDAAYTLPSAVTLLRSRPRLASLTAGPATSLKNAVMSLQRISVTCPSASAL